MQLADMETVSTAELLLHRDCSAAAIELADTPWYRRHHVGLKEGYVHEGTRNDATAPHLGLEDELEQVLAECTTDAELLELTALAERHGCGCIGEIVREAIAAEVNGTTPRVAVVAQRAASALATGRHENEEASGRGRMQAEEIAALIDTY